MQISISQNTTMGWGFDEHLLYLSERSIGASGLSLNKAEEFGIEKSNEMLAELKVQCSSAGSVSFYSEVSGPSLSTQLDDAQKAIRNAAELDSGCLILHTGGPGRHLKKNRFCLIRKALDRLLPIAEEFGVRFAVEPLTLDARTNVTFSHNLDDCLQLVNGYDSDHLGINLDLFHIGNEVLEYADRIPSARVYLIQLADFCWQGRKRMRCSLGDGDLKLSHLRQFLQTIQYEGHLELELFGEWFDFESYESTINRGLAAVESEIRVPTPRGESLKV